MADLEIRIAERRDAAALSALATQLGYAVSREEAEGHLERSAGVADRTVVVAAQSGRVVGWMEVGRASALESGAWAEISGLVVDQELRGSGVGTRLVTFARRWAEERGLPRLRVRTNLVRHQAAAFYQGLGFRLTKEQRVYDLLL